MADNGTTEILHDHYKETCAIVRDREGRRDRRLWLLLGLYALVVIQVQWPASVRGFIGVINVLGVSFSVAHLPLSGILNVTWVFIFVMALSYCGLTVSIERSYDYIHKLEELVSGRIGIKDAYTREGTAYLSQYPLLLDWTWICYAFALPAVLILGTGFLAWVEGRSLPYSWTHRGFDLVLAAMAVVTYLLYRVVPAGVMLRDRIAGARSRTGSSADGPDA